MRQRHVLRILQRMLHFLPEPVVDALGQQAARQADEQERRNQGKAHERGNELGPEPRSEQPLAPLKIGLDQVAGQQQDQDHQENDVHVQQRQDQDIAGHERRGLALVAVVEGQKDHRDQKGEHNQDRAEMGNRTVGLRPGRRGRRAIFVHGGHLTRRSCGHR